jgi:hypothetical protein
MNHIFACLEQQWNHDIDHIGGMISRAFHGITLINESVDDYGLRPELG